MKHLFYKELKLCLPLQVPLFFLFAAMLFIPSYPYLVACFFTCNSIFYMPHLPRRGAGALHHLQRRVHPCLLPG